jgi:hypothetical protein
MNVLVLARNHERKYQCGHIDMFCLKINIWKLTFFLGNVLKRKYRIHLKTLKSNIGFLQSNVSTKLRRLGTFDKVFYFKLYNILSAVEFFDGYAECNLVTLDYLKLKCLDTFYFLGEIHLCCKLLISNILVVMISKRFVAKNNVCKGQHFQDFFCKNHPSFRKDCVFKFTLSKSLVFKSSLGSNRTTELDPKPVWRLP